MSQIIFLDTETGGLDPTRHALLSVGLQWVVDGQIRDGYEVPISSRGMDVDPEALKVNGIDLERHNATALNRTEAVQCISEWMARHKPPKGRPVIGGHNVAFDMGFMDALFCGKWSRAVYHRTVCTLNLYTFLQECGVAPPGSARLGDAANVFGVKARGVAHTALVDATLSADLYLAMVDRVKRANYSLVMGPPEPHLAART